MADSLEYLERKQPPVGKKPHRLGYPSVFGSSRCSQDLEALADSQAPALRACTLRTQVLPGQ